MNNQTIILLNPVKSKEQFIWIFKELGCLYDRTENPRLLYGGNVLPKEIDEKINNILVGYDVEKLHFVFNHHFSLSLNNQHYERVSDCIKTNSPHHFIQAIKNKLSII